MVYMFLLFLLIIVVLYFTFFDKCIPYKERGLLTRKVYQDEYELYYLILSISNGMYLDVYVSEETFNKVEIGNYYVCELFDCENDIYINKIFA